MIDPSTHVHPTADIEADVSIGGGTAVWHHAQIRTGARVGSECVIGRDVFIDEGVVVGDRVKIQNGALLFHGVTVEEGAFIGPNATLTNDRFPRSITPDGRLAKSGDWLVSPIVVRRGASIGAAATIVAGHEIGPFATVGAGAVVTHDIPGYALVVGNPARRIGWVCVCGRRLDQGDQIEVSSLTCSACGSGYTIEHEQCVPDGAQRVP